MTDKNYIFDTVKASLTDGMNNFLSALTARVIVLSVCFLLFVAPSAAQQGQVYNQFFMNPYIYNPAYAGVDGHGVVFAMYKQQWSKIDDGPSFMHASYHMPLKGGIGFGVAGFRDTFGPLTTSAGKASASYLVNIDRKHFLRLGMSLGMGTNQIILPEDAGGDPAFAGSSSSHLIGEFGATYHFDHFNIGFSMPNLFSSELVNDDGSLSPINLKPTDRMLFKMNYRGHINHEFAIEPHILYRYSSVLPSQFEVATVVHVKHIAWVGATYRQDAGMVGLLGMKIKQKFAVGAAFELGNSDFNSLTGSTYEIHIGMHMGDHHKGGTHKKAHVDHHKSWFLTHSDELIAENEAKERREEELAQREDPDALNLGGTPATEKPKVAAPAKWNLNNEIVAVTTAAGVLAGQKLERTGANGQPEVIVGFAPDRNGGSAWALAGVQSYEERTNADGTREVAIKWVRIGEDGTLEEKLVWEPVLTEAAAAAVIAGETAQTPVDQPIEEPVVVEETIPESEHIADAALTTDSRSYAEIIASDQHLEVKAGGSPIEFKKGNYLIGGVFDKFTDADEFSQRMFHRGYRDTRVGYVSARGHYYVALKSYSSVAQANQDKARVKKTAGLSDVWVLKVND